MTTHDQLLIMYARDPEGRRHRRVERLRPGKRLTGASAPWVWKPLQATRKALAEAGSTQ